MTILSLTWEFPYMERQSFILQRGPEPDLNTVRYRYKADRNCANISSARWHLGSQLFQPHFRARRPPTGGLSLAMPHMWRPAVNSGCRHRRCETIGFDRSYRQFRNWQPIVLGQHALISNPYLWSSIKRRNTLVFADTVSKLTSLDRRCFSCCVAIMAVTAPPGCGLWH